MKDKNRYSYNMYEALTLLLCAAAVIYGALGTRHTAAFSVTLACAMMGMALGYIARPIFGISIMAVAWVGYLIATGGSDMLSLGFLSIWAASESVLLTYHAKSIEKEKSRKHFSLTYNKRMMLLDEGTELRSMRAYLNDAELYMRIAGRHKLGLALITWELENAQELKEKLGEAAFGKLMKDLSNVLSKSIRTEDMVYMLDDKKWIWGTLMLTDTACLEVIKGRILPKLNRESGEKLDFVVRWGVFDRANPVSPLAFMERVRDSA